MPNVAHLRREWDGQQLPNHEDGWAWHLASFALPKMLDAIQRWNWWLARAIGGEVDESLAGPEQRLVYLRNLSEMSMRVEGVPEESGVHGDHGGAGWSGDRGRPVAAAATPSS
ncbi:unnamed protein product [Symbiodinium natans]|uniref:Uncharacterized protein n=1 Tax=Symbiodinium natans TaxID=878477 RepID=A0A812RHW1_9DINO|nr:unnamed protein product [Symbiodinium natans]